MKKFEGILFCTDLDGTLFSDDKTVSEQNLEAIEYFKSEGGIFTFVTGRAPQTTEALFRLIKPNAPYGCLNGGGVYDSLRGEYLWMEDLPREVLALVKEVDLHLPEMGIMINAEKTIYFSKESSAMAYFRAVTGVANNVCPYDAVKEPILKIVFAHEEEVQMQMLMELLSCHPKAGDFGFIRSERRLFEILPKGVNKGTLLCKITELLGLDVNRTVAVGDYYNDVSMLQRAKAGFAVANAVDEAKAAADYITVDNNHNAIAVIVDMLDRGRIKL